MIEELPFLQMSSINNPFLGTIPIKPTAPCISSSKVRVVLRVRPFLPVEKELEYNPVIKITSKNTAEITNPKNGAEALNFKYCTKTFNNF